MPPIEGEKTLVVVTLGQSDFEAMIASGKPQYNYLHQLAEQTLATWMTRMGTTSYGGDKIAIVTQFQDTNVNFRDGRNGKTFGQGFIISPESNTYNINYIYDPKVR